MLRDNNAIIILWHKTVISFFSELFSRLAMCMRVGTAGGELNV